MNSAKLSSKFQLAIPKDIREQMNLKAGQQFAIITKIELAPIRSLKAARSSFKGCDPTNYR